MNTARLLFPALRWDPARGFGHLTGEIDDALARGVGGFIIFGGPAKAVRALTDELRRRAPHPLLIGADLERGAGQQFEGATPLPPLAAIGALDDLQATHGAGEMTGREALALGVNWVYAPVADVDLEPLNPIVGTRSFGTVPERVADHVAAWVRGCRAAGAAACAKHFPGHGRTVADSHAELPTVDYGTEELEFDLQPFRAAVDTGVEAIMTAHVSYPALDPSGAPATLSAPILQGLLREELGFEGLVVSDALVMQGVLGTGGETVAVVQALAAGCEALLYPTDLAAVAAAIDTALENGTLARERVAQAIERIEDLAETLAARSGQPAGTAAPPAWGRPADHAWALDLAERSLVIRGGAPTLPAGEVDLLTIDDDVGGPYPPPARTAFPAALSASGVLVREVSELSAERPSLIAVYCDIRGWKGRPGLSEHARATISAAVAVHAHATLILFGHPRLADGLPARRILGAWGGEALMQEAAARWLTYQALRREL